LEYFYIHSVVQNRKVNTQKYLLEHVVGNLFNLHYWKILIETIITREREYRGGATVSETVNGHMAQAPAGMLCHNVASSMGCNITANEKIVSQGRIKHVFFLTMQVI
jgi:hypothetical protein